MKIKFENNTLIIDTEFPASLVEDKPQILKDGRGNDVFAISLSKCDRAAISDDVIVGNAINDEGNVLAVIPMGAGKTKDTAQKEYGDFLINADKNLKELAQIAKDKQDKINALFA